MDLFELFRNWWTPRFAPLGGELDETIESIARLIDDPPAFRAKAKEAAERFVPMAIPGLRRRFHRSTKAPPGFTMRERGLTAWLAFWQAAIFEILYNLRERALPMLRKVAFGAYDWTQANAIEVLCRLAAEGIGRDRTIGDLQREMPLMRAEALDYAAASLLELAASDPSIAAIVEELRRAEEFDRAAREYIQGREAESEERDA